jgi:excisionase family DNA binding protein
VTPKNQTESTEHLMSPEELAEFLGISRTYTYQLLAKGVIPCARIGRLRKVRRTEVDRFVEDRLEQSKGDER